MTQPPGDDRRAARLKSLRSFSSALSAASASPANRLRAAGALMRRTAVVRGAMPAAEAALRAIGADAVQRALDAAGDEDLRAALDHAIEEAARAVLSRGGDRDDASGAMDALRVRDEAESLLAAARRWEEVGAPTPAVAAAREALAGRLAGLDDRTRRRVRWLATVNDDRRLERDLLDPEAQRDAWWYAARSTCDDLMPALAGEMASSAHLADCADCRHDLEATRLVASPPRRHLSADDLWRLEAGPLSDRARRRLLDHASGCPDCRTALHALEEGEAAIRGADAGVASPQPSPQPPTDVGDRTAQAPGTAVAGASAPPRPSASRRGTSREILATSERFRLVLERGKRVALRVEPSRGARLEAVAVRVGKSRRPVPARRSREGLRFDLGLAAKVAGKTVSVAVRPVGAQQTDERDFVI